MPSPSGGGAETVGAGDLSVIPGNALRCAPCSFALNRGGLIAEEGPGGAGAGVDPLGGATQPMSERDTEQGTASASAGAGGHEPIGVRVLAVSARASVRRRVSSMLRGRIERIDFATDPAQASEIISEGSTDLVVIERALGGEDGIGLLDELSTRHPAIVGVVLGEVHSPDDALRAMRAGACDMITIGTSCADATRRLHDAVEKARRVRQRDARIERLKKLCNKLNDARHGVTGQVGELCADLTEAYQDLSDRLGRVRLSSELETLLRQELDIESLLRTVLEYTLKRIGPVNAAVFMPTSSGDYSVGAYVNHDMTRGSAEVLLDKLADRIPAKVEGENTVHAATGRDELTRFLGDDAGWVDDATMLTVPCRDAGECLAVLTLFRDRSRPFDHADERTLGIIGTLLGEQLGRVIHTHHRHLPRDQWGLSGDWDAAPDDDPFGGLDDDGWFDRAA